MGSRRHRQVNSLLRLGLSEGLVTFCPEKPALLESAAAEVYAEKTPLSELELGSITKEL